MPKPMVAVVLSALIATTSACFGGADTGPTVAQLEAAKGKVHAMQPTNMAMSTLTPLIGPPSTQDDSAAVWFAKDGDDCQALTVQLMGGAVGNVTLAPVPCP